MFVCDLAETESFTKAAKDERVTHRDSAAAPRLGAEFKALLVERSKKKFR